MYERTFFVRRRELRSLIARLRTVASWFAVTIDLTHERQRPAIELTEIAAIKETASLADLLRPYLVASTPDFKIDEVPQRRGRTKYAVDLVGNPEAWYFVAGGEFEEQILVPGRIAVPNTVLGARVKNVFDHVTEDFSREGPFLVSTLARELAISGGRLVANGNPDSPTAYDLRIGRRR